MGMFNNSIVGMTHYCLQGLEDVIHRDYAFDLLMSEAEDLALVEQYVLDQLWEDEAAGRARKVWG
jgi:hypothetical protein